MQLFKRVAIVGTGLIGGSMALAIKKKRLAGEVIGVSRHRKSLILAKKMGGIDRGSQDFNIIKDADLIILATPVNTIISLAPKIRKIIKKDCIVSDVGSTKGQIALKLNRIFTNYIGSHPLAGSEKRGIVHASPAMFKNSLCILTPLKSTNSRALEKVKILWKRMGARVILLSPQTHDKILSFTSHLPHIIAFSLIDAVPRGFLKFASTSFRDATRIAASEGELWADIFFSNQKNIVKTTEIFRNRLSRIQSAIRRKDTSLLSKILRQAKAKRDYLNR